eukprot:jgi/Chrzof1/12721/Cz07g05060.t1
MSAPPTACCQLLLEGAAAHLLHIGLATCLKPLMYSNGESLVDAVLTIHVHNNVYVQVGVLVGKPAVGSRDILLAAIRTPSQEGQQEVLTVVTSAAGPATGSAKGKKGSSASAKTKSSGPQVAIHIETDWLTEHARQVYRMLPGGLAVLGLYLFAPETGYTSAANQLLSTYPSLHTDFLAGTPDAFSTQALSSSSAVAAPAAVADGQSSQPAVSELLLLHIDSTTCKYSLKSTSVSPDTAPSTGSLKPCELKFGSSMSSLICLQATHDVDMQLPATAGGQQLQEHAQQAVAAEAARIYSAVGAIDQRVGEGAQVLADLLPATASIDQPVNVDLYYQVTASSTASSSGSLQSTTTPLLGTGQIQGCIYGLAYVHKREPISKAISQLKCDLVKSLTARLDLLADDALSAADTCDLEPAPDKPESDHTNSSKNGSSSSSSDAGAAAPAHPLLTVIGSKYATAKQICLPSRVLLPWVGGLQLCDYLSEGEGPADAVARANELLGTSLADSSQVTQIESPAKPTTIKAAAVTVNNTTANQPTSQRSAVAFTPTVIAGATAAVVALLAATLGYLSLSNS